MILYKYVSHDRGMEIIENKSIAFSEPMNFNDPFELTSIDSELDKSNIFSQTNRELHKLHWSTKSCILSLTRQPKNPLMWSHYADEHKGMVIGIDASIDTFINQNKNIIPVQFGNIIYTETKPTHTPFTTPIKIYPDDVESFSPSNLEFLQRLFLYKELCWAYEEEVRVVKLIEKAIKNENATKININSDETNDNEIDKNIYTINLPDNAIKEIYLGIKSKILHSESNIQEFENKINGINKTIKVYKCLRADDSWKIKSV